MLIRRRTGNPVNYDLCNQTVTVYHKEDGEEVYTRKVYTRAFLDHRKILTVDRTGSKDANSFLLVIPGSSQSVFAGDKVYEGIGPEISDREAWRDFKPANVPGLLVVSQVNVMRWQGVIVHTEAGG